MPRAKEEKKKRKAGVKGAAPAPGPAGAGRTSAPTAGMSRDPIFAPIFAGGVVVANAAVF
jgi:hypothetical protein